MVLFVHGSPGTWDTFVDCMGSADLQRSARMVSADRPGFGGSGAGTVERSLEKQAAALRPILDSNRSGRPAVLVGHSYGGPVVARMAVDYPHLVGALVLVAPAVDPELEDTKWYQIAAGWPFVSWLVPRDLMTTNREIMALEGELEKLLPHWPRIRVPVTVIQGEKDRLVPPGNADFAARRLVNAPVTMIRRDDLNHFVPWMRPDLITDAVLERLEQFERPELSEDVAGRSPLQGAFPV